MKHLKRIFVFGSILFLFSSCAIVSDLSAFDSATATNSANFKYVKAVKAESSSIQFLGLGGKNNSQLAMDELKKNADLQTNQALKNVSVVKNVRYGVLTIKRTVIVTADVIEFVP